MAQRWAALLLFLFSFDCVAWGGRGHHAICHSAVFLMKEKGLQDFLRARPQVMGHLCNIPDIHWKSSGAEQNKVGSPTHWIDPEVIGLKLAEVPLDYKKIIRTYGGKTNQWEPEKKIQSVPKELGSLWWRADQFYRRAVNEGKLIKKASPPTESQQDQDYDFPYNRAVFGFMTNLGLIGHFVGDASMPFHSTADHDGQRAGHAGIHWFYEDGNVNVQDETFEGQIVPEARRLLSLLESKDPKEKAKVKFLKLKNRLEQMRELTVISNPETEVILKVDKILLSPDKQTTTEIATAKPRKGVNRLQPSETAAELAPLILTQLARSAALLAAFWDEAYIQAGRPDLKAYRSYQYPFTPDFVPPDYYDLETKVP